MDNSYNKLFKSEEAFKEIVYETFDNLKEEAQEKVNRAEAYVNSGAFEDQDAFTAYSKRAEAWADRKRINTVVRNLSKKPYIGHIEILCQGSDESEHYFLSDNPSLDKKENIGANGTLVPFKNDDARPLINALHRSFSSNGVDKIEYTDLCGNKCEPELLLMCHDSIENRELIDVFPDYPVSESYSVNNIDELLEQKLKENRKNPELKNIIETLQHQQFKIIEIDANTSFVVQGCPGSGKSQCLIHRLFYLRDTLSHNGWKNVLLITPSLLFRNYSWTLMRQYRLSDINNYTLSELYYSIFCIYDKRSHKNNYKIELSEEYLPDGYYQQVYQEALINRINNEIKQAINDYVKYACNVLGIPVLKKLEFNDVDLLIKQLNEAIQDPQMINNVDKLKRAKSVLQSVETTVFNQKVWKALIPLKRIYNIPELGTRINKNGKKIEVRILYKSELMFYIRIFSHLYGIRVLPQYSIMCIDEGQDLCKADYDLLRELFPKTAVNVFGDTDQVLRNNPLELDWKQETQIETIFYLDKNYRNEAGIVDFCNRNFDCNMQFLGKVQHNRRPKVLHNIHDISDVLRREGMTVIVKNREIYEWICQGTETQKELEFIDTNIGSPSIDTIHCYTIFAAKGLEFSAVLVISTGMTKNQKLVACTRAMDELFYYDKDY